MSSNYGPSSSSSVFPSSLGQSSNINAECSSTENNTNHALNENSYSQNLIHTNYFPDAISTSHDVSTELKFAGTSSSRVKNDTSRTDNAGDATPQRETDFHSMEQYIDYDGNASSGITVPQPVIQSSNASSEIITEASLDQTPTTFSPCLQSGSLFTPEPSPSLQLTLPEISTETLTSQLCTTEQRGESATGQGETVSNSSCYENNASNDLKGSTSPPLLESDSLFTPNPFSWLALPELPDNTPLTTGINQQQVNGKQENATGQGSETAFDPSRPGITSNAPNIRLGFVRDNSESDVLSSEQRHEPNIAPSITQSPVNTPKVKAKRVDKGKRKAQPVTVSAPITQYIHQPNNRTPFPTLDRSSGPSKGKSKEAQHDSQPASQGVATRFPLPSNDQSTMVSRPMNQYLQQSGSNVNGSIPYITNERPEFVQGSSNKFPIQYNRKNVISQQVSQPNRQPPLQQSGDTQIENVAVQRDTVSGPVNYYQPYNGNMSYMPTIQGNLTNCLQLTPSPQQPGSNHFWPNPSQVTPMAETEFQPSQYRNISHARYQNTVAQRDAASTVSQHSYPNSNLLQAPDQFPSNFPPNFPHYGHGSRTATPHESATYDALWVNEPEQSSSNINYNMPSGSRSASIGMQWSTNAPVQNIGGGNFFHAPQSQFHVNVPNTSMQAPVSNADSYNRAQTMAYSGDHDDDLHHVHGDHIVQWPRNVDHDIQNTTPPHFRNGAPFHLPPPSRIHSSSAVLTGRPAVPGGSILPHSQPTMQFTMSAPPPIISSPPFPLHTLAPVTAAKRKTMDNNLNEPSDGNPPPKRNRGRPPKNSTSSTLAMVTPPASSLLLPTLETLPADDPRRTVPYIQCEDKTYACRYVGPASSRYGCQARNIIGEFNRDWHLSVHARAEEIMLGSRFLTPDRIYALLWIKKSLYTCNVAGCGFSAEVWPNDEIIKRHKKSHQAPTRRRRRNKWKDASG